MSHYNELEEVSDKNDKFKRFKELSQRNIANLIQGKSKFYEYKDYKI